MGWLGIVVYVAYGKKKESELVVFVTMVKYCDIARDQLIISFTGSCHLIPNHLDRHGS